jgi:hypothetical protein
MIGELDAVCVATDPRDDVHAVLASAGFRGFFAVQNWTMHPVRPCAGVSGPAGE